jgi:hypothetical protein
LYQAFKKMQMKMRKRGFEPLRFNPLDPKSSASASSATLALSNIKGFSAHLSIARRMVHRAMSMVQVARCKSQKVKTLREQSERGGSITVNWKGKW